MRSLVLILLTQRSLCATTITTATCGEQCREIDTLQRIYAYIHGTDDDPFWLDMEKYAEQAASHFGVELVWVWDTQGSNSQAEVITAHMEKQPQVPMVVTVSNANVSAAVKSALALGARIYIVNSLDDWDSYGARGVRAIIAMRDERAGREAANYMIHAGVRRPTFVDNGTPMGTSPSVTSKTQQWALDRWMGFKSRFEEVLGITPQRVFLGVNNWNWGRWPYLQQVLKEHLVRLQYSDQCHVETCIFDGIFAAGQQALIQIVHVLQATGCNRSNASRTVVGVVDDNAIVRDLLQRGDIDFIINQRPFVQGYVSVALAATDMAHEVKPHKGKLRIIPDVLSHQENMTTPIGDALDCAHFCLVSTALWGTCSTSAVPQIAESSSFSNEAFTPWPQPAVICNSAALRELSDKTAACAARSFEFCEAVSKEAETQVTVEEHVTWTVEITIIVSVVVLSIVGCALLVFWCVPAHRRTRLNRRLALENQLERVMWDKDAEGIGQVSRTLSGEGRGSRLGSHRLIRDLEKRQSETAGVSVAYLLSEEFQQLALDSTICQMLEKPNDPTFHEIGEGLWKSPPHGLEPYGQMIQCPRTGRRGCAFVDTLPREHRQLCTHFLSWTWLYNLSVVRSGLREWVAMDDLDSYEIFLWMCFFTNNQFDILIDKVVRESDRFEDVFQRPIERAGKMLALLDCWDEPQYLTRIWTIFEMFTAARMNIEVRIIFPEAGQRHILMQLLEGRQGFRGVTESLCAVDSSKAEAWDKKDEETVRAVIEKDYSYDFVNQKVQKALIKNVCTTMEISLKALIEPSGVQTPGWVSESTEMARFGTAPRSGHSSSMADSKEP